MEEKRRFRVEKILEKETSDKKKFWVLRNNREGYFVWEKGLLTGVDIGSLIEIIVTKTDTKFPKVMKLRVLDDKTELTEEDFEEPIKKEPKEDKKEVHFTHTHRPDFPEDSSFLYAIALENAVNSVGKMEKDDTLKTYVDLVTSLADLYYDLLKSKMR
jgi:spore germination cell wall hydrolase CwlJ-like protein